MWQYSIPCAATHRTSTSQCPATHEIALWWKLIARSLDQILYRMEPRQEPPPGSCQRATSAEQSCSYKAVPLEALKFTNGRHYSTVCYPCFHTFLMSYNLLCFGLLIQGPLHQPDPTSQQSRCSCAAWWDGIMKRARPWVKPTPWLKPGAEAG